MRLPEKTAESSHFCVAGDAEFTLLDSPRGWSSSFRQTRALAEAFAFRGTDWCESASRSTKTTDAFQFTNGYNKGLGLPPVRAEIMNQVGGGLLHGDSNLVQWSSVLEHCHCVQKLEFDPFDYLWKVYAPTAEDIG
ncbi:unnamed protein product, partial [Amoebophrya sp. A120]|eukprot:GSA120T00019940001.1